MNLKALALTAIALFTAVAANAQPVPYRMGDIVPATTSFTDANGKTRTLQEFRGSPVVLEWFNNGCPFVRKHYDSGNMQSLQGKYTAQGVKWVSVISSAKGKQGYLTPADAPAAIAKEGSKATAVALDSEGILGIAFGAQTTPHMYILNAEGKLVYMGAIDSIPSFSKDDIAKATNYVSAALDETIAGKTVTTAQTNPYGCSVKY